MICYVSSETLNTTHSLVFMFTSSRGCEKLFIHQFIRPPVRSSNVVGITAIFTSNFHAGVCEMSVNKLHSFLIEIDH